MPADPAGLDRLRGRVLGETLAALSGVDPSAVALTWPAASGQILAAVTQGQTGAAGLAVQAATQVLDRAVGFPLGWALEGLSTWAVSPRRLGLQLSRTPHLVAQRVAAGMAPADALAPSATWATQVAGSVVHDTARRTSATVASGAPGFSGWRWMPEAGACPWCRMQASRGAVFKESTVRHSHAHCKCSAEEVTDRAEAARIAAAGRAEWERMVAAGDVPGGRPLGAGPASATRVGAVTPERLASVRTQIGTFEGSVPGLRARVAAGDETARRPLAWQEQQLESLHAEERSLSTLLDGGGSGMPPPRSGMTSPGGSDPVLPGERLTAAQRLGLPDEADLGGDDFEPVTPETLRAERRIGSDWSKRPVAEQETAKWLGDRGLNTLPVAESTVPGVRSPDAVDLAETLVLEFKAPEQPSDGAIRAAIRDGRRKARYVVLDVRECGMAEADAVAALADPLRRYGRPLQEVLIIGDGYDRLWTRR